MRSIFTIIVKHHLQKRNLKSEIGTVFTNYAKIVGGDVLGNFHIA